MDVTDLASRILSYGEICDNCLGRFFGKLSHGLSNQERGHALRIAVALQENRPYSQPESCWVCGGLLVHVPGWAERASAALSGLQYEKFAIGTRVPPLIAESEEIVWSDLGLAHAEPLKSEMNREVGKAVARLTGKTADPRTPMSLRSSISRGRTLKSR